MIQLIFDTILHLVAVTFFFFKQKTAYDMRISDWSSDVCSSDLWMPASAPCNGPSTRWPRRARCSRSGVGGPVAGWRHRCPDSRRHCYSPRCCPVVRMQSHPNDEACEMQRSDAQILREYGPFPDADCVHGVSPDGAPVRSAEHTP